MKNKVSVKEFFTVQWKVFCELVTEYGYKAIALIILTVFCAVIETVNLKVLEKTVDSASLYFANSTGENLQNLIQIFVIFACNIVLLMIMLAIQNRVTIKFRSVAQSRVEVKTTKKLSEISYEYFEFALFHEKIEFAKRASGQYANGIFAVTEIANIAISLIAYVFLLSRIHFVYICAVIVSVVICSVIAARVTQFQLDYWRTHVSPESRRQNYFQRIFGSRINQQNIQMKQSFSFFSKKYSLYAKKSLKNTLHLNWLSFFTELLSTLFFIATFIATSIFVGRGVVKQIYTMGFFSMVFSLLVKLFTTIKQFTMFILNKSEYIKFLEAYYDVLELPNAENQHELLYKSNEKPLPVIRLDEIKYQYPQAAQEAINGISTEFYEGEKIAVVGLNGSGKSTLMSIILSLFQNYSGRYSLSSVAVFSAVLQDFAQYQMSVKENIEIGCGGKSLPDAKIQSILQSVGLWGEVQSLPQGIHTQLGQLKNGIELSKGQWQRLALGRLLANEEANVWILDEPTAFLDPLAEIDIYKLMFKLSGTRTVFFISHRLGFASSADRIIVVHKGKITENGKHSELMKNGNLYAKMFDSQKEWYL